MKEELLQIDTGQSPGFTEKAKFLPFPGKIPIESPVSAKAKMSPWFSTTAVQEPFLRIAPAALSAIAPATQAIGPTPARALLLHMSFTIFGAQLSASIGESAARNAGCFSMYSSRALFCLIISRFANSAKRCSLHSIFALVLW
jgi:hypothetical protein